MSKFFCIGHFKTGTASYSQAMGMLGLRDLHFPRRYVEACNAAGRPVAWTGKWDSMSNVHELPDEWAALQSLYPDAKFILTTRNVDKWLASIRKHMERAWPPDLARLFDARFQRVFGVPCRAEAFDADVFQQRFYDQHFSLVRECIDPKRLLVLDLDSGDDLMAALSIFVERQVRYPHLNKQCNRKPGEPLVFGGNRRKYVEAA